MALLFPAVEAACRTSCSNILKLLTPENYASSKTSDLRATIKPGKNELNLELKSG